LNRNNEALINIKYYYKHVINKQLNFDI